MDRGGVGSGVGDAARQAEQVARQNKRLMYGAAAGAAVLGYLWWKRRSDVDNVGDAAARAGAATGRALERAGEGVKDEGRGFQGKKGAV